MLVPKGIQILRHMEWVLADQGRWAVKVLDQGRVAGRGQVDFRADLVLVAAELHSVLQVGQVFMVRVGN